MARTYSHTHDPHHVFEADTIKGFIPEEVDTAIGIAKDITATASEVNTSVNFTKEFTSQIPDDMSELHGMVLGIDDDNKFGFVRNGQTRIIEVSIPDNSVLTDFETINMWFEDFPEVMIYITDGNSYLPIGETGFGLGANFVYTGENTGHLIVYTVVLVPDAEHESISLNVNEQSYQNCHTFNVASTQQALGIVFNDINERITAGTAVYAKEPNGIVFPIYKESNTLLAGEYIKWTSTSLATLCRYTVDDSNHYGYIEREIVLQ